MKQKKQVIINQLLSYKQLLIFTEQHQSPQQQTMKMRTKAKTGAIFFRGDKSRNDNYIYL